MIARAALLLAVALGLTAAAPAGPRLIADLSEPRVDINYGFAGAELLVYGAIQYPRGRVPDEAPRLAVVARGPSQAIRVRQKERVAGIWLNTRARDFATVPSYVAVATSRPIEELVDTRGAAIWEIGLSSLQLSPASASSPERNRDFRLGLIDLRRRAGLYREEEAGVLITENILYRARLVIPASAPVGRYEVLVHLIRDGAVVATATRPLEVRQTGFEARVSRWAREQSLPYGLAAVAMALGAGWAASLIGRAA